MDINKKIIDISKYDNKKYHYFINNIDANTNKIPFLQSERLLGILSKKDNDNDDESQKAYDTFYNDLALYSDKIPNSFCKKTVDELISRKLIFLGKSINNLKTGNIGAVSLIHNKISGIILDVSELNINILTGESENIDNCFYAIYFQYIRALVNLNSSSIIINTKLNSLITSYLSLFFIKLLSKNTNLVSKQKLFLESVTTYFYLRFMLNENHNQILYTILENLPDKNLKQEFKFLSGKLDKYTSFKNIYNAFLDFNIFQESPSVLLMKSLNKITPFILYNVITTLDHLIALIVLSSYNFKLVQQANINTSLQKQIETELINYSTNVNYDLSLVNI